HREVDELARRLLAEHELLLRREPVMTLFAGTRNSDTLGVAAADGAGSARAACATGGPSCALLGRVDPPGGLEMPGTHNGRDHTVGHQGKDQGSVFAGEEEQRYAHEK